MIYTICRNQKLLAQKAVKATMEDLSIAEDLLETLKANSKRCVGMAANMIGIPKAIIAFQDGEDYQIMFNPTIVRVDGPYSAEEGCLSLDGQRKTIRYQTIQVLWTNKRGREKISTYTGFTAQIIQHEIDHLAGLLI